MRALCAEDAVHAGAERKVFASALRVHTSATHKVGSNTWLARSLRSCLVPIVCGTDFSEHAAHAERAAAAIASRRKDAELWLVHVLDRALARRLDSAEWNKLKAVTDARLRTHAEQLRQHYTRHEAVTRVPSCPTWRAIQPAASTPSCASGCEPPSTSARSRFSLPVCSLTSGRPSNGSNRLRMDAIARDLFSELPVSTRDKPVRACVGKTSRSGRVTRHASSNSSGGSPYPQVE